MNFVFQAIVKIVNENNMIKTGATVGPWKLRF